MHKTFLAAVAAVALAGGVALTAANAQTAPATPPAPDAQMPMPHHGPMGFGGWMHHPGFHGMHRLRQFALIFPAADRALTGADVQKIAEAFLLWNGNHSWKVTNVAEEQDRVTFAFATPDGTVIARFAMDRHTGRPTRLG
jgi:hypothetical protein